MEPVRIISRNNGTVDVKPSGRRCFRHGSWESTVPAEGGWPQFVDDPAGHEPRRIERWTHRHRL